ncbi:TRZ4 [Scenedesmus sp. PABB004]|nr:TRZ4 [Scenedesmus sp. PABB004]
MRPALLRALLPPRGLPAACRAAVAELTDMGPRRDKGGPKKAHYTCHAQVFNVDNRTASPSVLLTFDSARYLFNAGEGIQRHFIEYKQKMNRITTVLATRVHPDALAGLPGMLLSQVAPGSDGLSDDAVKAALHGPDGLARYCGAFRQYASSFKLDVRELGPSSQGAAVADDFVSITPVPLLPASGAGGGADAPEEAGEPPAGGDAAAAVEADGTAGAPPGAAAEEPAPKRQRTAAGGMPGAVAAGAGAAGAGLGRVSPLAPLVLSYVCQLSSTPGKFDPQKAAQLGVPRGPLFGELQRGKSVTAANGRVVTPADVMDPPELPGACLVVVDCPSAAYLPALQDAPALAALREQAAAGGGGAGGAAATAAPAGRLVLVHLGPAEVTGSDAYRAWLAGFGARAEHLAAAADAQAAPTTLRAAVLQAQLNAIEPDVFSLQGFAALAPAAAASNGSSGDDSGGGGGGAWVSNGQRVANGYRYTLAPNRNAGPSPPDAALPDLAAVQAAVREGRPALHEVLQTYRADKAAAQAAPPPPQLAGFGRRSAELTLLGTCSACPSNHRNVSAYYLDLFDRGGLLADCGEDTMGQLERRFGRADAARRVAGLRLVWVSHMHADHHGGLYPLLLERERLLAADRVAAGGGDGGGDGAGAGDDAPPPLVILGPWPLFRVLCEYSKALPLGFAFLPNNHFYAPGQRAPPPAALAAYEAASSAAGLAVARPFAVQHVAHSSGLQLESVDGWKLVFSGDTRPCAGVVEAARGATLLVHEATFDDELADEAVAKKHSTTAEALSVAADAGAFRTVLTHFSTRYPKIPVMRPPPPPPGGPPGGGGGGGGGGGAPAAPGGSDLAALGSVLVGFDLMSLNLADLGWAPKMLPVLDELFREEAAGYADDDDADGEPGGGGA